MANDGTRLSRLGFPRSWDDLSTDWMTVALADQFPGARVESVSILLRDDGTNRRARLGLDYASGIGPATVFVKAESDIPGRRGNSCAKRQSIQ